jgi:thiol-disulfide isomerase/thioredoxin
LKRIAEYSFLFFVFLILARQISTWVLPPWNFLLRFCLVFILVLGFCRIRKPTGRELVVALLLGMVVPDIVIRLLEEPSLAVRTMPDLLIELLAVANAWILYRHKQWVLNLLSVGTLVFAIVAWGSEWLHYVNFGNRVAAVNTPIAGWAMVEQDGDTLRSSDYRDRIVVFDIWNTGCVSCLNRFPKLEVIFQRYKDDPGIFIQALNIPLDRDTNGMAFEMVRRRGFNFPVVVAAADLETILNIDAYPLVLVTRNNNIIFRGKIEELEQFLEHYKKTGS